MSKAPKAKPRNVGEAIANAVRKATGKWTATKKSEERHPSYVGFRRARMTNVRGLSQKDAAAQVMEAAYMSASSNGTLPATARQTMYPARPKIEALTGGKRLDDQYFCQTLLPDYMEEHRVDWDIVFDARGHFSEPHDGRIINLGTLGVRSYLDDIREAELQEAALSAAKISTCGPHCNFGAVLFIEKEGFQPLFERVKLAERHDIAIMSTKGVSVTAARLLVDRMCSAHGIPLLVMHDFDVAGFTILDTLRRDTRRYQFESDIKVIDLGLRLADVRDMGLQPESAATTKSSPATIRSRLRNGGATAEEADFLVNHRVELNAMTSDHLIAFIERKLAEHDVKKLVPDKKTLDQTYRLFERSRRLQQAFEELEADIHTVDGPSPNDIEKRVATVLERHPEIRWDAAVNEVLEDDGRETGQNRRRRFPKKTQR